MRTKKAALIFVPISLCFGATYKVCPTGVTEPACTHSQAQLQALLRDQVACGDTVLFKAGASYTLTSSGIKLYGKGCAPGVYITLTSDRAQYLPPEGTTVTPAHLPNMATFVNTVYDPLLKLEWSATAPVTNYRIVGLAFTSTFSGIQSQSIRIGWGPASTAGLPDDIIVDRCYFFGNSADLNSGVQNVVVATGRRMTFRGNFFDDLRCTGFESHAISGDEGSGPVIMRNNYFNVAGIASIWHGGRAAYPDPANQINNYTIENNYFYKSYKWFPYADGRPNPFFSGALHDFRETWPNDSSGTEPYKLVKLVSGKAKRMATTDSGVAAYGIAMQGAGTSGTVSVAVRSGRAWCVFDNAATVGNTFVSSTMAGHDGECHDTGRINYNGQVGIVKATDTCPPGMSSCAGMYEVYLYRNYCFKNGFELKAGANATIRHNTFENGGDQLCESQNYLINLKVQQYGQCGGPGFAPMSTSICTLYFDGSRGALFTASVFGNQAVFPPDFTGLQSFQQWGIIGVNKDGSAASPYSSRWEWHKVLGVNTTAKTVTIEGTWSTDIIDANRAMWIYIAPGWRYTKDVTIDSNVLMNAGKPITIMGAYIGWADSAENGRGIFNPWEGKVANVTIRNNLMYNTERLNYPTVSGHAGFAQLAATNTVWDHNTFHFPSRPNTLAEMADRQWQVERGWVFKNNIVRRGLYGIKIPGYSNKDAITQRTDNSYRTEFANNLIHGDNATSAEFNNSGADLGYCDSSHTRICANNLVNPVYDTSIWQDAAKGNFRLWSASPARNAASDGSDIGADVSKLPLVENIEVVPATTTAQFGYTVTEPLRSEIGVLEVSSDTDLITDLCIVNGATSAPPCYAVIGDVDPAVWLHADLDNRTGNVIDGLRRTWTLGANAPLSPDTTYYYRLILGGVVKRGQFTTLASGPPAPPLPPPPPPVISALTLTAEAVGGTTVTSNRVAISAPAPSAGTPVTFSSSDPAVVRVPASVLVPAGQTSAAFAYVADAVSVQKSVVITAAAGGASLTGTVTVRPAPPPPPVISALTLTAEAVGGTTVTSNRVTISAPAPSTGTPVTFSSSDPAVVRVPASVLVPAGQTSAAFAYVADAVSVQKSVVITAAAGGASLTGTVTVRPAPPPPPVISALTLTAEAVGGTTVTSNRVAISAPAPSTGTLVTFSSSDPAVVRVPASVLVPAGQTSAGFSYVADAVSVQKSVVITAAAGGASLMGSVTVRPATTPPPAPTVALSRLQLSPTSIRGGAASSSSKVFLTGPAGSDGARVTFTSSDPAVVPTPGPVTVPPGASSAQFTYRANAVSKSVKVVITATSGGVSRSSKLGVKP